LRSRHKIPPTPTNPSPFFNCPKDEDNRIGYSRVQWKKDVGKGDTQPRTEWQEEDMNAAAKQQG
jgi:hypothetical protein